MTNVDVRVKELLNKMTIEEKIAQLSCTIPMLVMTSEKVDENKLKRMAPIGLGRMTQYATGFYSGPKSAAEGYNAIQKYHLENSRLGIPILMQNESAAGLVAKDAPIYPVPIALAATFEPSLANDMGKAIAKEARAIGVGQCLSPVADVAREYRWGRVGETFGEDVTLVTQMSVAKAKGLQGEQLKENVISCAKHYMGYAVSERGINTAVINLGEKDLLEVHGTPFRAMIKEADLQSVMVTYSEIDGLPMSVNKHYLDSVLRQEMGFNGSAVCDAMSIPKCHRDNGIAADEVEIACLALKAGVDADTPITQVYQGLKEGVARGLVTEADIDVSVARVLKHKFDLGLFENPYVDVDKAEVVFQNSKGHQISKEICEKEITLIKNDGILPLSKNTKKISLIGPFANRLSTLFGGYAYPSFVEMLMVALAQEKTSMEGISDFFKQMLDVDDAKKKLGIDDSKRFDENLETFLKKNYQINTLYESISNEYSDSEILLASSIRTEEGFNNAITTAKNSDVIIATLGEVTGFGPEATAGEGVNNSDLNLPGRQEELLVKLSELGKPIILILFNGRPLVLNVANKVCNAILEVWYPGTYGSEVITNALVGKLNPGGKLPVTFPRSSAQCPIYYSHKMGSGYRSINDDLSTLDKVTGNELAPLYHFGHGLSYTEFSYSNLVLPDKINNEGTFEIGVEVKNIGKLMGDEVVQVYFQNLHASVVRPVIELRGFKRITLMPKESKKLTFTFDYNQFGYYNVNREFVVEPCLMKVWVGSSSIDLRCEGSIEVTGKVRNISSDIVYNYNVK